jgi:hypothetical protein
VLQNIRTNDPIKPQADEVFRQFLSFEVHTPRLRVVLLEVLVFTQVVGDAVYLTLLFFFERLTQPTVSCTDVKHAAALLNF